MSIPPEVEFDRFLRNELRAEDRHLYKGKQDLDALSQPQLRTLLASIQDALNQALSNEKQDIPEHVPHPPFHFDYVESSVSNAVTFRSKEHSFIGITIPLVYALWEMGVELSGSKEVATILGTVATPEAQEQILGLLFPTQLSFVVSHEYTHIVHGHVLPTEPDSTFPNEILDTGGGNLALQAHEVDADGYAVYHVLEDLLNGTRRSQAVGLLNLEEKPATIQDETLLSSFVIAVGAFLYIRPPIPLDNIGIYKLMHPPQAARMNYIMHYATTWAKQNRPHLAVWMTNDKFQMLMCAVATATWGLNGGHNWQAQATFLRSEEGSTYLKKLDESVKNHIRSL